MTTLGEAIDAAVAERGRSFKYRSPLGNGQCRYIHEGPEGLVPGCLIGNAVVRLGVDPEALHAWELENEAYDAGATFMLEHFNIGTPLERAAAGACQGQQDEGISWGVAADTFHQHARS